MISCGAQSAIRAEVASLGLATALKVIIGEEGEGIDPFTLKRHEVGTPTKGARQGHDLSSDLWK